MFGAALFLIACESMDPSSHPFAPAALPPEAVAAVPPVALATEPEFAFPVEPPLEISSEEMAATPALAGAAAPALEAVAVDAPATPDVLAAVATPGTASPGGWGVPAATQWPVRLVSTLPAAQPPRAILGLPSGEERVVSPGSILAEQGLVVMSVSAGRVQLARIEPAGDHAKITTLEIAAQYP